MKRFGKLLAILLAVTMVFGMLPAFASAEGAAAAPVVVAEQTAQTAPAPAAAPAAETPAAPEKEATLEPMASAATKIVNALKVAAKSDPGNADLKVSGADGNTYWFATATATNLGHALALAAGCGSSSYTQYTDWKDNPGTITLLKDVDIECSESKIFEMSNETVYNNGKGVTFDLDGHTLKITNGTDAYLITWERYKLTIKNGTLIYINNGGSKGVFFTGTESGAMSASSLWTNTITLTDLNIYVPYSAGAEYAHTVFTSYAWPMVFNITNCVLLSEGGKVLDIHATDFETKAGSKAPSKSTVATITVTNSVLGSISSTFEEPVISDIIAVQGDYTLGAAGVDKGGDYSALDGIKIYEGTKINIDADSELVYNTTDAAVIGTEEASCLTSSASVTDDGTYSVPEEACFLGGKGPEQEYVASYTSADGQTTTEFGTLTEAIKASQADASATVTEGGWVTLLKDASVGASEMNGGSSNTVYGGTAIKKALNIDLNKHTLTNTSTANLFYFRNNTVDTISLTMKNGTILQNGGRRVISYASDFGGTANDTNEFYLTLKDLTIECSPPTSTAQGFFNIKGSKGTIDIDGCTFINASSDGNAVVQLLTDTASVFDQKFTVSVKNSVFDLTKCKHGTGPAFLTIGNCNESATRDNSITIDDASRFYYKTAHTTTNPLSLKNNSDGSSPLHIGEKAALVENLNDTYNKTACKSYGYYEYVAPAVATYTPVGGDPQECTSLTDALIASQDATTGGGTITLLTNVDTTEEKQDKTISTNANNLIYGDKLQKDLNIDLNGKTWTDSSARNLIGYTPDSNKDLHIHVYGGKIVKKGNRAVFSLGGNGSEQKDAKLSPVLELENVEIVLDQNDTAGDLTNVGIIVNYCLGAKISLTDVQLMNMTQLRYKTDSTQLQTNQPPCMVLSTPTPVTGQNHANNTIVTLEGVTMYQANGKAPIDTTTLASRAPNGSVLLNVKGDCSFYIAKNGDAFSTLTAPVSVTEASNKKRMVTGNFLSMAAVNDPASYVCSDEENYKVSETITTDVRKIAYKNAAIAENAEVLVGDPETNWIPKFEDMALALDYAMALAEAPYEADQKVTVKLLKSVTQGEGFNAVSGTDAWVTLRHIGNPEITFDLNGYEWDGGEKALLYLPTGSTGNAFGGKLILKNGTIRSAGENGIAYVSTENQGNYEIYGGLDAQGVTFESTSTTAPYLFKVYGHGTEHSDDADSSLAFTFDDCEFITAAENKNLVAFAALAGNNVKDGAMTVKFVNSDFSGFNGKYALQLLNHTYANMDNATLATINGGKILEGFEYVGGDSPISFNKPIEGEQKGASLTMQDTISLNISIPGIHQSVPFTYKVIRTDGTESEGWNTVWTDENGQVTLDDLDSEQFQLAAQDMRDRIYGTAVAEDGSVYTVSTSILDYCKRALEFEDDLQPGQVEKFHDLAKATMNYGYFADMYFNLYQKKSEFATPAEYDQAVAELRAEYPHEDLEGDGSDVLTNADLAPVDGAAFVGCSAVLLDTLTLRFYFDDALKTGDDASYQIESTTGMITDSTPVKGTAASVSGRKTYTYVDVPVNAADANATITVTLGTDTVQDSIASYLARGRASDSDDTVKATLNAVGRYVASAITYFADPIEPANG